MEYDWCLCGRQTFSESKLYCSSECQRKELSNGKSPPASPPTNCRFSVAMATTMLFPNDLTSTIHDGVSSPQSSAASSYTESNPCSSVTSAHTVDRYNYHRPQESLDDGENYYYSTSAPINIRQPATADNETLEINKGTFGEAKLHL